jgi:protein-S-isoprenylcysteine O-methyltransferase Ste14
MPFLLVRGNLDSMELGPGRWFGMPLVALGASSLLWCIVSFAREGKGTLAPVDPPRFVVRGGPYRLVRNPMYLSLLVLLVGEAILFESAAVAAWAAFMAVAWHLFVVLYEEPTMTRLFGEAYLAYRRAVPRWIPRVGGDIKTHP